MGLQQVFDKFLHLDAHQEPTCLGAQEPSFCTAGFHTVCRDLSSQLAEHSVFSS